MPQCYRNVKYMSPADEMLFEFVEGNEPHWMNLKGSHCDTIEIDEEQYLSI